MRARVRESNHLINHLAKDYIFHFRLCAALRISMKRFPRYQTSMNWKRIWRHQSSTNHLFDKSRTSSTKYEVLRKRVSEKSIIFVQVVIQVINVNSEWKTIIDDKNSHTQTHDNLCVIVVRVVST